MAKKDQTAPPQQELFVIEGNVPSRDALRKSGEATNVTRLYRIKLGTIKIRPDRFNARIKPDWMPEEMWEQALMIAELADKMYVNNGPVDPILGDFHKDGNFYINDGERRTRGLLHLIATGRTTYPNGELVEDVLVLLNPPNTTDLERKKKMHDANDNLPLTIMQKAHYYLSFTQPPYELTHDQIAALWPRLSRQTVSNYIKAALELPKHVQDAIDDGGIKITNALAELRKDSTEKRKSGTDDKEELIILSPSQEFHREEEQKKKDKLRGDEEEFDQQDNSVTGTSSKGGPKEDRSSGEHAIPKDSIYMQAEKKAIFKQFFNRFEFHMEGARKLIVADKPSDEHDGERAAILYDKRHEHAMLKMMNEYDITVK